MPLFFLSGPQLWHMEIPWLGVKSKLQLPAYTIEMPNPSHVCSLHSSSWKCWILNPLSESRDRTCILMDTSRVCNSLSYNRDSYTMLLKEIFSPRSLSAFPRFSKIWKQTPCFFVRTYAPHWLLPRLLFFNTCLQISIFLWRLNAWLHLSSTEE